MLTADLVRARRRSGELQIDPLTGKTRARAAEIAALLLATARDHVGRSRGEVETAWREIRVPPSETKLRDGLEKLVDDACDFAADATLDPRELRREVFSKAAAAWRSVPAGTSPDREQVLSVVAAERGLDVAAIESALYADLRSEHVLRAAPSETVEVLLERYDVEQVQAVLLRAVEVVADVTCASPLAYRSLFRALKFRRLLYRLERGAAGGYRIVIDGPFSLFESVTKYGLELALVLPALRACDALRLEATVRWGKDRENMRFRYASAAAGGPLGPQPVSDEVAVLAERFRALDTDWSVQVCADLLDLPGVGLIAPDLIFERRGVRVYFESLGFWSRQAVWRRVELVEKGLSERVLFAVSSRLRVSEGVLGEGESGALYVYKGSMSERAVARKLDGLADSVPRVGYGPERGRL